MISIDSRIVVDKELGKQSKRHDDDYIPPASPLTLTSIGTWDSVHEFGMTEARDGKEMFNYQFNLDRALRYFMAIILCGAGLFDIIATLLPIYFKDETYELPEFSLSDGIQAYTFQDIVHWFDDHDVSASFWFSAIWFMEAYVAAGEDWRKASVKKERNRLLGKQAGAEERTKFWEDPTFVYWRRVVFQVLLLPVGFFFTVYYVISQTLDSEEVVDFDAVAKDGSEAFVVSVKDDEGSEYFHQAYNVETTIALLFAILQHAWLRLSSKAVRVARKKLFQQTRGFGARLARRAIFHPRRFQRNLRKALTAARWFKYLAPLIGTANKLKGNVEDMLKKRRQAREAEKFKKARQLIWKKRSPEELLEYAARRIQKSFRARRARKYMNALKKLKGDREHFAALKVQRVLRQRLAEARERIRQKKEQLKRLQNANRKMLTEDEIKQLYELQNEIGEYSAELLNRKLLLRPNTKFAVTWKVVFVFCVILEISYLAITPWLEEVKSRRSKDPMTVPQFVAKSVVPIRIAERSECKKPEPLNIIERLQNKQLEEKVYPWYCDGIGAAAHEGATDFLSLALIPSPVSEWPECDTTPPKRPIVKNMLHTDEGRRPVAWYCDEPYSDIHWIYRNIFDFLLDEFVLIVGLVCYLDVFITFFTGELDPNTGMLIPKPFFVRWILPGLLLQMLVNPIMGSTSDIAASAAKIALSLGPVRVIRWCLAVVFPLSYLFVYLIMHHIWIPFTDFQNANKIIERK